MTVTPDALEKTPELALPLCLSTISGYSSVAIKEASGPKCLLLLFDHAHIYMLLHGVCSLQELVGRVRRHASQTGEASLEPRHFS